MFNDRKAGQVAAYFANAASGRIGLLKLIKLIYLADREAMRTFGTPITFDRLVAMPHGPVNSQVLDLANGFSRGSSGWAEWISARDGNALRPLRPATTAELDELSPAELSILEQVWDEFGGRTGPDLRTYTHDHCPEWRDPNGGALPITYEDVFRAVGRTEEEARRLAERVEDQKRLDNVFEAL